MSHRLSLFCASALALSHSAHAQLNHAGAEPRGPERAAPALPPAPDGGPEGAPSTSCSTGLFHDDLDYLLPGPLGSGRWSRPNPSIITPDVIESPPGSGNLIICQTNTLADNLYREVVRASLPISYAIGTTPVRLCVKIQLSNPHHTVHAVSLFSTTEFYTHSRVFIGREDPSTGYTSRVYVQTNQDYNPVDPPGTTQPFANNPVIGVDVADTGYDWPLGAQHNLCLTTTSDGIFRVEVDGLTIHTGPTLQYGFSTIYVESEFNAAGAGDTFCFDDVIMDCNRLHLFVNPPPFVTPYTDDFEWGLVGVNLSIMGVGGLSTPPFIWATTEGNVIVQGAPGNQTKLLRLPNRFPINGPALPGQPGFVTGNAASCLVPTLLANSTQGWAQSGMYMLTDGLTSRTWSGAGLRPQAGGGSYLPGSYLTFSSVSQTLWYGTRNTAFSCANTTVPNTLWFDTGVSLQSLGINFGDWFRLSVRKHPAGNQSFRINGRLLRDAQGNPVLPASIAWCPSSQFLIMDNLYRIYMFTGHDAGATNASILYADNLHVWRLPCVGDANDDAVVNFADLNIVLSQFGLVGNSLSGNIAPDADNNGVPDDDTVNFTDLNAVLSGFGVPCG